MLHIYIYDISPLKVNDLTLILLTWRKWWAPNNASKQHMGFNSGFKGLITCLYVWLSVVQTVRIQQLHAVASAPVVAVATGTTDVWRNKWLLRGFSQATHGENCVTSVRQASHSQSMKSGYEFLCPVTKAWTVFYLSSFFLFPAVGDLPVFWVPGIKQPGWRSWPLHSSAEIVNVWSYSHSTRSPFLTL